MKEKPILFSGEMVRAILKGRKTQTRRVVKLIDFGESDTQGYDWHFRDSRLLWNDISNDSLLDRSPYGKPGDRLWVKEPFRFTYIDYAYQFVTGKYSRDEADFLARPLTDKEYEKLRLWKKPFDGKSSLFMFKSLSRLWLEITNVRVERLQDISDRDAIREGCYRGLPLSNGSVSWIGEFADLWDSINSKPIKDGKNAVPVNWNANPWVWAVEFRRM